MCASIVQPPYLHGELLLAVQVRDNNLYLVHFSIRFVTFIIYRQSFNRQRIFLTRVTWRIWIKQTNIAFTNGWIQIEVEKVLPFLKFHC